MAGYSDARTVLGHLRNLRLDPMPYAVRNIPSHVDNNPNSLDREGNDLKTSIELLKSWVAPKKK